jgi:hypothetical protein
MNRVLGIGVVAVGILGASTSAYANDHGNGGRDREDLSFSLTGCKNYFSFRQRTVTDRRAQVTMENEVVLQFDDPQGGPAFSTGARIRVTAADHESASLGGLLVVAGLLGGVDAATITAALASIQLPVMEFDVQFAPSATSNPTLLSQSIEFMDSAYALVVPGGGCIVFRRGILALGLAGTCATGQIN